MENKPKSLASSDNIPLGIGLVVFVMLVYMIMDAFAKGLVATHHFVVIVWVRFSVHTLVLLLLMPKGDLSRVFNAGQLKWHALRALCLLGLACSVYVALFYIPLAEVAAIVSTAPFMVAVMAAVFLGEYVGKRRWVAIIIGFAGALLVIRPGLGVMHWAAVIPLFTALCFAAQQLLSRYLSQTEPPWKTLVYSSGIGALILTVIVPFFWQAVPASDIARMMLIGVLAAASDAILLRAFHFAPASVLAPYTYVQLVWAALIGYLWFGDFPDAFTLAGSLVIVASGLVVLGRKHARLGMR